MMKEMFEYTVFYQEEGKVVVDFIFLCEEKLFEGDLFFSRGIIFEIIKVEKDILSVVNLKTNCKKGYTVVE